MSSLANGPSFTGSREVPPATLPNTPSSSPIPEQELIKKARHILEDLSGGIDDPSVLADNFRFEFPVVKLDKKKYLEAVRSFGLKKAFPNYNLHSYHWRVDLYEPNRVWWTTRSTGTHDGPLKFGPLTFKPTHKEFRAPPEVYSFVFNEEGKVVNYTGGYVIDRRVGNTQGYGALFGILAAIGAPIPGSPLFFLRFTFASAVSFVWRAANTLSFGVLDRIAGVKED